MKVVLFCGGQGMRLREFSEAVPKPMVNVGFRPILWNVMKYYAHFGHKEFILCLGWQSDVIKNYFLNYNECLSNDFRLSHGGHKLELINSDIDDWKITFADTGINSNIGERLKAVQPHLRGEDVFLANYSDGMTDFSIPKLIDFHRSTDSIASFLSVRPTQSFHAPRIDANGRVRQMESIKSADVWMNAGFFVLSQQIFDYIGEGEELVEEPFSRLIDEGRLHSMRHDGYFGCMDTYKEKQELDDMFRSGNRTWEIWNHLKSAPATGIPTFTEVGSWSLPQLHH